MTIKSLSRSVFRDHQQGNVALSRQVMVFALLLIVFVVLRFWHLTSYSLWGGETFSIVGVRQDWNALFSYLVADIVHPPFYSVLLKFWILLGGESLFWLKLFPVISGVLVVVPFILFCRELNLQLPVINIAILLLAVNGYMIHYAQEIRMYSLFMFLAMCSFWLFIRFMNSEDNPYRILTLLTIVNLLLVYTHYFGWIAIGVELLFLLIWKRRKVISFTVSVIALLLCFSPWAYLVIKEARAIGGLEQNLDWIPVPDLTDILNFYVSLNGPLGNRYLKLFSLIIFGFPIAVWSLKIITNGIKKNKESAKLLSWLALLSVLPVVFIFIVSQFYSQAAWMDRYFIFIAIPYLIMVATAVHKLGPKWIQHTWIGMIVLWSLIAGANDLTTNRMAWESPQLGSRANWESLANRLSAAENSSLENITVYTIPTLSKGRRTGDWALSTSLDFYLNAINDDRFQMVYYRNIYALLDETNDSYFWIAFFELEESYEASPREVLLQNGYLVGNEISYQEHNNKIVLLPVWRN
jgi:mannosyltransferase